jgi:inner membrane protein
MLARYLQPGARELMPSAFSHAAAGLGIAACFCGPEVPAGAWALGAICGALPDVDVIGFRFGVRYGSIWGHRGITHSLLFAAAVAAAITGLAGLGSSPGMPGLPPGRMWLYLFLATISHSLLDALTNGGQGVALLAPFDNRRFFFPVRPIEVASFGVRWLFTRRGAIVLASELRWVWLPAAALAAVALLARRLGGG